MSINKLTQINFHEQNGSVVSFWGLKFAIFSWEHDGNYSASLLSLFYKFYTFDREHFAYKPLGKLVSLKFRGEWIDFGYPRKKCDPIQENKVSINFTVWRFTVKNCWLDYSFFPEIGLLAENSLFRLYSESQIWNAEISLRSKKYSQVVDLRLQKPQLRINQ